MRSTQKKGRPPHNKTQTEISQQTIKTNKNIVKETQVEYSDKQKRDGECEEN